MSHSRCAFSRIFGIFSMILPPSLLNHMKTHMLFGYDGVNSFENIPILLGKFTAGMALYCLKEGSFSALSIVVNLNLDLNLDLNLSSLSALCGSVVVDIRLERDLYYHRTHREH